MPVMTNARINTFLTEPRIAHLVTIHPNQSPHVSPVWYAYSKGQFEIFSDRKSRKVKNINENYLTALSIAGETEPYESTTIQAANLYISIAGVGGTSEITTNVPARSITIKRRAANTSLIELAKLLR